MISLELLTNYTHEHLRYHDCVKVFSYKEYERVIHISYDYIGEIVKKEDYFNWLKKRRRTKINKIIN